MLNTSWKNVNDVKYNAGFDRLFIFFLNRQIDKCGVSQIKQLVCGRRFMLWALLTRLEWVSLIRNLHTDGFHRLDQKCQGSTNPIRSKIIPTYGVRKWDKISKLWFHSCLVLKNKVLWYVCEHVATIWQCASRIRLGNKTDMSPASISNCPLSRQRLPFRFCVGSPAPVNVLRFV